MKFAEWKKLDKEEKIKQASSSIMIGSVDFGLGDNTDEFINELKGLPEISTLDLLIEGGASRQRAAFAALTKYLTQDQHLSKLTIRSTYKKGDFFSEENHYGELEIFKALAINISLTELRISCYNVTPNDIETFLASIRKNPKSKLQKVTFLHNAWFNSDQGQQNWQTEQDAINDYLAIRPLEITLTTTIDKFQVCASALSQELVDNLNKIFEGLKKYNQYKTIPENPNFPAITAIKAIIALADAHKYLVDDHNKLTRAAQCHDIFNELDESIDITSLDTNKLKSLVDRLLDGAYIHFQVGRIDISIIERLNYFKTKITKNTLLETEYEEIFGILKTIKYTSRAFTMQIYQELGAKYPVASQELGNIYFNKADPKYKILAALYFFQAGMNANQELLRACKQLILTTFSDKVYIDTAKNEQLNYFLKLQFNLQALLKNETTDELTSACNHVLNLITPEIAIENKGFVPQQEIVDQLENLTISVFPEDKKVEQSCEVIIKHMKGQQPKPDDMTTPDRDKLYAETQKYLEEYSPKFGKPLSDIEKKKQPIYYAVAVYVRILLELSDPIIKDNVELFKRIIVAKKLWSELTPILPFHQEIKQIYEPILLKYVNNFTGEDNPNKDLPYPLKNKTRFEEMFWYWRQSEVNGLKLSKQLLYLSLALKKFSYIHDFITFRNVAIVETLLFNFIQQFTQKLERAAKGDILKDIPLDWIQRQINFKAAPFMKKIITWRKDESSNEEKEFIHLGSLQVQITKLMAPSSKSSLTKFFENERAEIANTELLSSEQDLKSNKQEERSDLLELQQQDTITMH